MTLSVSELHVHWIKSKTSGVRC